MLQVLFGRSGSGKTQAVREMLKEKARAQEGPLFLLVPEQASFENERAMLHLLGAREAQRVQVLSFSRLCDTLFRTFGGGAGRRLTAGGRRVLMSEAIEGVKDSLTFYRKSAEGTALVELLLEGESEFKLCGVSPGDLEAAARRSATPALGQKLSELSLILSAYEALVEQSFLDPQDDLTKGAALLLEHPFFTGASVAVDGFQSFTVQEYGLLRPLLRQAKEVTVSLCADQLDDPEKGLGLFSLVRRTASTLIRMAKEEGAAVAAPVCLEPGKRFSSPDLAALEDQLYRSRRQPPAGEAAHVLVYTAKNVYDEADFAAATIRRLLAQGEYRCRDLAVVARSLDPYRGILDAALQKYELPYFMDEARDVASEPLMRLVLSAFQTISSGFDTEAVLTCVKTGLTGVGEEAAAELENYCFLWDLSGSVWKEPFTAHPRGFSQPMTEADELLLARLNEARETVVRPLLGLRAATYEATGLGMAKAVYHYLEEAAVAAHLKALSDALERAGQPALADDALRLWDLLMELLDQCALTMGDRPMGRDRFAELLRLVISQSEMAGIPQGLDEVTVGAANRIRVPEPKVVFLLGACQGEFPQTPGSEGILSFSERLSLIQGGLPLNDTLEGVAVQERFLAYAMAAAPSERLYLSWPSSSTDGTPKQPSSLVSEVLGAFDRCPQASERTLPEDYFAVSRRAAFQLLARRWKQRTPLEASLRTLFSEEAEGRLAALRRAASREAAAFTREESARALFSKDLRLSASQIELFHQCRFQYFCRYGMNVQERRPARLDALEYGSLMHYLLERLFKETGAKALHALSEQALRELVIGLLDDYVEERLGGMEDKAPRFAWLLKRVADAACVVAAHIARELSQSKFVPSAFELPVGPEGVPGLRIALPDGGFAEVDGTVDRVDVDEVDGVSYLRVVDYKTGKKEFRLSDVLYGVNLQMLLYLAALCENGGMHWKNPKPAGILYMPADRPVLSVPRGTPPEKVQAERDKKFRMNGLLLDDPAILTDMEADGAGVFVPASLKDGMPTARSSVVSGADLGLVLDRIRGTVAEMAEELHKGSVEAKPLLGEHSPCRYCDYGAVCGREEEDPAREMEDLTAKEALERLRGGDGDGA